MELSAEEIRVLGCLMEKAATTPDHYPLTTNALVTACNQKSSREPVVAYTDRDVTDAMLLLRPEGLARTVTGSGRTEKHRHVLDEAWGLNERQLAVLAVLMLRGPQTPGELRQRTDRYVEFSDLSEVDRTLESLAERSEPLVVDLGRRPGQSQNRWTHLLRGEPTLNDHASAPDQPTASSVGSSRAALESRLAAVEARLRRLEEALGLDEPDAGGGEPVDTAATPNGGDSSTGNGSAFGAVTD